MRSAMLEQLQLDYVRALRAKGLGERFIILRRVLRNALVPIISLSGIQIGALVGYTAIVEFIGRGTHRGELAGIAPTGRKVELPVITVLEIKDGKVHIEREYMDSGYLMQQLGVVPAPATA